MVLDFNKYIGASCDPKIPTYMPIVLVKRGGAHTQLPLKMTWALTIHKSQGMTLPMATLDIGNVECQGLTFTTISKSVILKGPTHIPDIHL